MEVENKNNYENDHIIDNEFVFNAVKPNGVPFVI